MNRGHLNTENMLTAALDAGTKYGLTRPRRWMAKYGNILYPYPNPTNQALYKQYGEMRREIAAKVPVSAAHESELRGYVEHRVLLY